MKKSNENGDLYHMMLLDKNRFYGKTMSEKLPVDESEWKKTKVFELFTKNFVNSKIAFLWELTLCILKHSDCHMTKKRSFQNLSKILMCGFWYHYVKIW